MIEILGIFVIVGVLSIGAIAGFRYMVARHMAHEIMEAAERMAFFQWERFYRNSYDHVRLTDLGYSHDYLESSGYKITMRANIIDGTDSSDLKNIVINMRPKIFISVRLLSKNGNIYSCITPLINDPVAKRIMDIIKSHNSSVWVAPKGLYACEMNINFKDF